MQIEFEKDGRRFRSKLSQGISISIVLDFDGEQPSHFAAPPATRLPIDENGFVGSVAKGGSCNVDVLTLNPHCNGTHTETVGHIAKEVVPIANATTNPLLIALLLTIKPRESATTTDTYRPKFDSQDSVIDRELLENHPGMSRTGLRWDALVIRTLPNGNDKQNRRYGTDYQPPFFTIEAMQFINQLGIQHLVVDLPSIDRMHDEGRLTNHHLYWNVTEGSSERAGAQVEKTITEMAFVPDRVDDGLYLLNLQFPAFGTDAAPSRPILYRLQEI